MSKIGLANNIQDQKESREEDEGSLATANPRIGGPDRSSDMSFQCMGKALYFDEAAWLRSPLEAWSSLKRDCNLHIPSQNMPRVEGIEAWLSDTSSFSDIEDNLLVSLIILSS